MAAQANKTLKGWPGFEMKWIDRFMRASHAELGGAAIGALISFATLVAYSALPSDLHLLMRELRGRAVIFGFFAITFAIGGWWTVRTWRRLWRRGRSQKERAIYDFGVRTYGFSMAVSLFFIVTWLGRISEAEHWFGPLMVGGAIAAIFFGVPISLHLGYFWGRIFAAVVGAKADPRIEVGEPPHLT
jgi:hypothetical protein